MNQPKSLTQAEISLLFLRARNAQEVRQLHKQNKELNQYLRGLL